MSDQTPHTPSLEEIARTILPMFDQLATSVNHDGPYSEAGSAMDAATALMPLVKRAQAEAWSEGHTQALSEVRQDHEGRSAMNTDDEREVLIVTDADLDRLEGVADPIYRSTAEASKVSKYLVSDLGQWIVRLVAEVRRLRTAEAEDERIDAWHMVADHEAFKTCYDEEQPLIDSVLDRITVLHEMESTVNELAPAPEPQGEPTDAQVHAAAVVLDPSAWEPGPNYQSQTFSRARDASLDRARAALRAAGGVR